MVALIVIALSLLHLINTAGVLLAESRDRFELFGSAVYSQAASAITVAGDGLQRRAHQPVRRSRRCSRRSIRPTSSTRSIVDPTGIVIASSDPAQVGKTVPRRPQLNE